MRNILKFKRLFPCLVFVLTIIFLSNSSKAQVYDQSMVYRVILHIGNINPDAVQDTIIGVAGKNRQFIPKFIVWGNDTTYSQIPDSLKVQNSRLDFPPWQDISIKCAIDKFNADTLEDMMFIMWGKVLVDTTYRDTTKAVMFFGKLGLDTLPMIEIFQIDTFLTTPFVGMNLEMGRHFIDAKQRDFSGVDSYQFIKDFPEERIPIKNYIDEPLEHQVKVYPNPAVYYTNVELNNIQPGNYTFQVISSTGNLLDKIEVTVEKTNNITNIINLDKYASGAYYIRITSPNKLLGTYPVIVLH